MTLSNHYRTCFASIWWHKRTTDGHYGFHVLLHELFSCPLTPQENWFKLAVLLIHHNMVLDKRGSFIEPAVLQRAIILPLCSGIILLVFLLFQFVHRGCYLWMSSGRWCLRLDLCIALQLSAEERCSRQQRPSQRQIQPCEAPSVYQWQR